MLAEYVVEGLGFIAIVAVDADICGSPYIEAATITLEQFLRRGPHPHFKLLTKDPMNVSLGAKMFVYKNGDLGDDKKAHVFKTADVALNAGIMEVFRRFSAST